MTLEDDTVAATELSSAGVDTHTANYGPISLVASEYGGANANVAGFLRCCSVASTFTILDVIDNERSQEPISAAAVPVSQYDQLPAKVEFNYADPAAGFVDSSVLEEEVLVHGAVNKKSQKQLYREPGSVEQ